MSVSAEAVALGAQASRPSSSASAGVGHRAVAVLPLGADVVDLGRAW